MGRDQDPLDAAGSAIDREAAERYASGEYPEDLDDALLEHFRRVQRTQELNPDQLQILLQKLDAASAFGPHRIPYVSSMPMGPQLHRAIGRAVGRQTTGILLQVREFALVARELLAAIIERLPEQERALETAVQLNARVDGLLDQLARTARAERRARADLEGEATEEPALQPRLRRREFMERFWGSTETILARYADLADRFAGLAPVLDVGCGRGEMLRLLTDRGVEASGVDLDPDLVAECQVQGFRAVVADGLEYLQSLEDGALGGVFAGQVIEHLDPEDLVELVAAAFRKLRPGGLLILETINPESLYVFAHSYYLDPSHVRMVPPAYLTLVCETLGFSGVEVERRSPVVEEDRLEPLPAATQLDPAVRDALNRNFERLNRLVFAPQDYALIATR